MRLHLPSVRIEHFLSTHPIGEPIGCVEVSADCICIPDASAYMHAPERLMLDLHAAVNAQMQMQSHWYLLCNGLWHATEKAPYDCENADAVYLTLFQKDAKINAPLAQTNYIRLDEHYRLIAESHGKMVALANSIDANVTTGIKQAVRESQMTLEQIHDERDQLETQKQEIENRIQQLKAIEQSARERKPRSTGGYVYLLQSSTGYWKIGRTHSPNNRLRTFNVKLPFEVEYKHLIQTDDMYALENQLHERFKDKRINGEWFTLDSEDVREICALRGFE